MPSPTRLTSDPLPPYAFVPGRRPHPVSHPEGHSHGRASSLPPALDPGRWWKSHAYLLGCDLFNHGFYWEAHEAWEGLWIAAGRTGPMARFLQALIHLAAAGVKVREGRQAGVRSHADRAAAAFMEVERSVGTTDICGLNLRWLRSRAEEITNIPPESSEDGLVVRVFDFLLEPQEKAEA